MQTSKSIFSSKSLQGAMITLISSLLVILINCSYDKRYPSKDETLAASSFVIAFCWTLVGRSQKVPTYTPKFLPGANKADFVTEVTKE